MSGESQALSMLRRNAFLILTGLFFATSAWKAAHAAEPAQDEALAYAAGVQAYINGYPMMDLYRTLWETSFDPQRGHDRTLNEFFVFDRLITSKDDWVVTPNEDTIYSRAFFDLRKEPVILTIPPTDRQYWVPVSDLRHDHNANLSWAPVGARGGNFALCAPGWQGVLPAGVTRVDMDTPIGWTLPRFAVDGPADLPAAVELQKQVKLIPLSQWGAANVTRQRHATKARPGRLPALHPWRAHRGEGLLHDVEYAAAALAAPRQPDGRSLCGLAARARHGPRDPVRLGHAIAAGATRPRTGSRRRAPHRYRTHAARRADR